MLILLTDGNDTSSAIPPERAADIAKSHKLVVHTIGIGDPDTTGEDKVDLDALARISEHHGRPRRFARSAGSRISPTSMPRSTRLTPEKVKREIYRPQRDFYWVPAAAAVAISDAVSLLALLIAVLRAPGREARPERSKTVEAGHGN